MACAIATLTAFTSTNSWAATAAYYRHEEGVSGQFVPGGPDTVLDSSGNGNHMQTFSSGAAPFTAATYTNSVSPLALRSGLTNTLALDFGESPTVGTDDGGGRNDDNYTVDKTIQTQLFTAMTVELAFNMHSIGGFQTLFGKDGKPLGDSPGEIDSPLAPLQIKVRGDDFPNAVQNQLFVEWIDGDGDIHSIATGETVQANTWYHVAFTLSATDAELWVAGETGDYVLKGAISGNDFAGSLGPGEVTVFEPAGISIGRGMFNNGVTDWSNALIDEVRISDTALTPNDFLFLTEPGGVTGDFDGNGVVTGRDFLAWQRNPSLGNLSDWQNAYPGALAGFASVPEPASLVLVCGLVGVVLSQRRRMEFFIL
jgi:hypothetical protein